MNKKKLLSLALVVILIATISFSTLAWFSDADEVTNKFMVAGSDDAEPDEIFSVTVVEDAEDKDGNKVTGSGDGFTYENILPGDKLYKKPFVCNTGSYDQYIRVIITVSDAQAWVDALGANFNAASLFDGFDPNMWVHVWNNLSEATEMPEDLIYVLYLKDVLPSQENIEVFQNVLIPTTLTQEQAAAFSNDGEPGFTIKIKAQAVQTENVVPEGTAASDAAWAAFETVGMSLAQ